MITASGGTLYLAVHRHSTSVSCDAGSPRPVLLSHTGPEATRDSQSILMLLEQSQQLTVDLVSMELLVRDVVAARVDDAEAATEVPQRPADIMAV